MDSYSETQECPKCHKQISKPNFDIHEAMCKGSRQSFILNVNDPQFKHKFSSEEDKEQPQPPVEPPKKQEVQPNFQKPKEQPREEKPPIQVPQPQQVPKPTHPKEQPKEAPKEQPRPKEMPKPIPQPRPEQEERFPCTYCGYMMTMAELDTHPDKCAMHTVTCPFCKSAQPEQLLNEHKAVCPKRPRPQEVQPPQQPPQQREREPRTSPRTSPRSPPMSAGRGSPISSQSIIRFDNGRRIERIINTYADGSVRTEDRINGVPINQVIEEDDDDQDIVFMIDSRNGLQRGMPLPFPNIFFGGGRSINFERMVAQLMGQMRINRSEHPGLSEEEIKRLPIVKYNKETNGKKCTNCTICIKDYVDGDVLIKLPCDHLFNKECIYPWLKESSVCPNCRGPVKPGRNQQRE